MPLEKSILSAFSTTLNDHSVEWTDEQIIEYPVCCALLEISSDLICAMDDGRSWPYLFRYDEIYEKYYSEYGVPSKNKLLSLRHGLLQILSAKQLIEYSAYFTVDEIRALFDAIDRQCVASRNEACNLSHVGLGLITLKNSTLWTRKNWTALLTKAGQCDCSLEFESDLRNLLNWEILTQGHFDYVMNSTGSRANVRLLLENFYQRFILLEVTH